MGDMPAHFPNEETEGKRKAFASATRRAVAELGLACRTQGFEACEPWPPASPPSQINGITQVTWPPLWAVLHAWALGTFASFCSSSVWATGPSLLSLGVAGKRGHVEPLHFHIPLSTWGPDGKAAWRGRLE